MENSKKTKQLVCIAIIIIVVLIIGICVYTITKKSSTENKNISNVIVNTQEDNTINDEPQDSIDDEVPDSIATPSEGENDIVTTSNPTM